MTKRPYHCHYEQLADHEQTDVLSHIYIFISARTKERGGIYGRATEKGREKHNFPIKFYKH